MARKKAKKQIWKTLLTVVTFLALVGTVYALRSQLFATIENLRDANPWPVLLVPVLAVLNHLFQARMYQGLFRILGNRFRTKAMMRMSLELNLVNNVFPSGGVSGFSYLSLRMRSEGISAAKATLVQMMRFALLFISFQVLLAVGLLFLAIGGDANDFVLLVAGSLGTFLFMLTAGAAYVLGNEERIDNFLTSITRILNRVIRVIRPKHPETINILKARRSFAELHVHYGTLRSNIKGLKTPTIYALATNVTEITAIFCVFLAFGIVVNPGAIIIAYAVANFAGLISVLPGGVGIYEALMTGVFATAGVTPAVSLPVVVAYRVLSMSSQLPIGYYFYQKMLHYRAPEGFNPS